MGKILNVVFPMQIAQLPGFNCTNCMNNALEGVGEYRGENIFEFSAAGDRQGNAARQGAPCRGGK